MNRGFLIILVPAFLVALGYILIFRYMGVTPGAVRIRAAHGLQSALHVV